MKFRKQIINKIHALTSNPNPIGAKIVHGVMDGTKNVYRIRSGDYRVLYSVRDGPLIAVLDIGDRKDIYR